MIYGLRFSRFSPCSLITTHSSRNTMSTEAIFIGANKQTYVADNNPDLQLVAYGAANTVALWNPLSNGGVFQTLKKHTDEVTGVRFIPNSPYLISVGADTEVNIWKLSETTGEYAHYQVLQCHSHSVTCLAVVNRDTFVTGGADGKLAVWVFSAPTETFELAHTFKVSSATKFYPTTLALQDVDVEGNYVLVIGGTSRLLHVYTFTVNSSGFSHFEFSSDLPGHEDWIKCLSFVEVEKHKSYILASGSQDRYIRLWRLNLNEEVEPEDTSDLLTLLSNKKFEFKIGSNSHGAFNFDALIMGHDDWVSDLKWHPSNKLQLLSSSADTALMVWEMDADSGIWCCINRLGEMSIKGASTATGASGGFWSCLWIVDPATNTEYIMANGKTGSFRLYKSTDPERKSFESVLGVTGAVREVSDLAWSAKGDYLLSTSYDQTTRLFAPWVQTGTWHEFARPQIHGYDMICVDTVDESRFVSGGDEKVLRVFEMTDSISKILKKMCNIDIANSTSLPESATLPVLGLSNKAANEQLEHGDAAQVQQDIEEGITTPKPTDDILSDLTGPPLEDYLQRYTLFPELEKLYGHGYEITCCATSPDGVLIASACRSNSTKHATIRLFNTTKDYQQVQQILEGHSLTITSLEFSQDGKFLLAVSRDRQFSLWQVQTQSEFTLVELNQKAHNRIIWDCSWVPQNEFGAFFITGSRDKAIKLWQISDMVSLSSTIKLTEAVTSVSAYKHLINGKVVVAIGLESGAVSVYSVDLKDDTKSFKLALSLDKKITPAKMVSKLSFSAKEVGDLLLGVGSNDTSVRLYKISRDVI